MKCIHHNDSDGRFAAGIVCIYTDNKNLEDYIELDYDMEIPYDKFTKDELVYIVDFSFGPKEIDKLFKLMMITENIIWIDHHSSSIKSIKQYSEIKEQLQEVIIQEGTCGALLTYKYFLSYMWTSEILDKGIFIPLALKLLDDFDCWKKQYPESNVLNYGLMGLEDQSPSNDIWKNLLRLDDTIYTYSIIEKGKLIESYFVNYNKDYMIKYGYDSILKVGDKEYKVKVVNTRNNSLIFGDDIDKYDIVCCYWSTNKDMYQYSIFSIKEDIRCDKIAENFGGGGHFKAAGFILDYKLF